VTSFEAARIDAVLCIGYLFCDLAELRGLPADRLGDIVTEVSDQARPTKHRTQKRVAPAIGDAVVRQNVP
jgi:hypothetical protein